MKRSIVNALVGLISLGACAAGWDGAYIGGKTVEGKCFYARIRMIEDTRGQ